MAKSKRKNSGGLVFSTDPDFEPFETVDDEMNLPNSEQVLRVWLERGKGGKESTIVKGYVGGAAKLAELAKVLKSKCAAGGNAKDGIIIVQGNHRDKVVQMLQDMGYTNTKKAGG
ncbi:MAG: translation initiation factor [Bacteroidetes bacterium]|nr:MAG: translation initiation factor [Bacteroidota bacterium]